MSDEKEIWKVYPDYDFIEVSNLGRVKTKDRIVTDRRGRKYHIKGRVLKQQRTRDGYVFVEFRANGKAVRPRVNRLVAICFIPNPDNLPEVNHIDNDPTNNRSDNLEWCSRQYNSDYKKNFGTSSAEVLGRSVIAINRNTSEVFWFKTQLDAGRQLGVSQGNISNVVKGRYNKTGDYWFTYANENAVEKTREKFGDEIAEKVEKLISKNYN